MTAALRFALPATVLVMIVALWQAVVVINGIPHYVLPGPGLVASTLVTDWTVLAVGNYRTTPIRSKGSKK